MAKLTVLIISLVVFSLIFVAGFGTLMASINENYNVVGYNKTRIDTYNKLSELYDQSNQTQSKAMSLTNEFGVTDVLGGFFVAGYNALKVSFNSFGIFYSMSDQAFEEVPIQNVDMFKMGIITIAIVSIIIGIILRAVIKQDV